MGERHQTAKRLWYSELYLCHRRQKGKNFSGGNFIAYIICHMEKYQRNDIVGVERENERDENYRSKLNPQIDRERTRFNHHFIKPNGSYTAFINRRLKGTRTQTQGEWTDAVLMASFLIGASPEFFKNKEPRRHRRLSSLNARTSSPNVMDEGISSPPSFTWTRRRHTCHLNLMPILEGRPCAKKLFDRKALVTLQSDLHKEVGHHWNLKRGEAGSKAQHLEYGGIQAEEDAGIRNRGRATSGRGQKRERLWRNRTPPIAEQRQAHSQRNARKTLPNSKLVWSAKSPLSKPPQRRYGNTRKALEGRTRRIFQRSPQSSPRRRRRCNTARRIRAELFRELQQAERKNAELQRSADLLKEIKELAPEKLDEALETVKERKAAKRRRRSNQAALTAAASNN